MQNGVKASFQTSAVLTHLRDIIFEWLIEKRHIMNTVLQDLNDSFESEVILKANRVLRIQFSHLTIRNNRNMALFSNVLELRKNISKKNNFR